jgi:hypothetical protein
LAHLGTLPWWFHVVSLVSMWKIVEAYGSILQSKVIWEAQFGDFANTAQVMVDQFLSQQVEI